MPRRLLRITTILIVIHSLIFFPAMVSRAQDRLTEEEILLAQAAGDLFLKRLDETGDFSRIIDEMYAEDFIKRYIQEQMVEGEESDASSTIYFAAGLDCKRDLLKLATEEDWKRLYVATNNFIYHIIVAGLNKYANDMLNGRELDDETIEKLVPPNVLALFDRQPALKSFLGFDIDKLAGALAEQKQSGAAEEESGSKPIETPEEMRAVIGTLQDGLRLLLKDQGDHSPSLTESAKSALEMNRLKLKEEELMEPTIGVSDKKYLGLPPGTRILNVPTPFMFWLTIAEVNGKQKIVWAQFLVPTC